MSKIIGIILVILFIGILVLLCFFSCILASISDECWEQIKKDLEKHKNDW
jgi:hypothetical protein